MALRRRNLLLAFGLMALPPVIGLGIVLAATTDGGTAVIAAGLAVLYVVMLAIAWIASSGIHRHAVRSEHLAHHDPLTALPNRALFSDRLKHTVGEGAPVAVIVADLDRFKDVNDKFGHLGGDAVLLGTAERLRAAVRVTDTVARLGGDEFGVLLPGSSAEVAEAVARRILDAFAAPFEADGTRVQVAASLGVACSEAADATPRAILHAADSAMYEAKRHGGGFRTARESTKAPGQAIGGLRPVRRAASAKSD